MRADGGKSRVEGNLLEEDIRGGGREQGKGESGRGGIRAKGDGFIALVAKGGGGDDDRIKLDHGGGKRE